MQLLLGVDQVLPVVVGQLVVVAHRQRPGRAGLDAQAAEDAAQVVDLVDRAVPLTGREARLLGVVAALDVDRVGRAGPGAQLAADALLQPVGVPVEHVPAVVARLGHLRLERVLLGGHLPEHLREGDAEALGRRGQHAVADGRAGCRRADGARPRRPTAGGRAVRHRRPPRWCVGCRAVRCSTTGRRRWRPAGAAAAATAAPSGPSAGSGSRPRTGWARRSAGGAGRPAAGPRVRGRSRAPRRPRPPRPSSRVSRLADRLAISSAGQHDQRDRHADVERDLAGGEVGLAGDRAHGGDDQDPDQRGRDQHLPAEPHELVVAQPGQRAAQPDEDEQRDDDLEEEPEQRPPAGVGAVPDRDRPRRPPAAEEQRRGQRRDGDHVDVLGEEEQRELQRRVLGVEAADQLALGLGEVERRPVGLADHGDHVDDEGDRQQDREPARAGERPAEEAQLVAVRLRGDDVRGRHRAGVEEHRDDRQPHRDLVADHLGGAAQPAEQRVGRAGGPAGQHDAVDAHRRAGQHDQHADRGVGELQRRVVAEDADHRAERDDREGQERRDRGDDRRQEVDRLVGQRRHDVFLERQLQPVGQALQVAARADPVRADPLLHPGDDLALEHDREQRHARPAARRCRRS